MRKMLSQKNLMILVSLLAVIKFALMPLLDWQKEKLNELEAKAIQLRKVGAVMANKAAYAESILSLQTQLSDEAQKFYVDNARTKLSIQTDIEQVFSANKVMIDSFNWGADSSGLVRVMRAKVRFSGSTENMIRSFWELAHLPRWVRQVESNQQLKNRTNDSLGVTAGNVTLEFYALDAELLANAESKLEEIIVGGGSAYE